MKRLPQQLHAKLQLPRCVVCPLITPNEVDVTLVFGTENWTWLNAFRPFDAYLQQRSHPDHEVLEQRQVEVLMASTDGNTEIPVNPFTVGNDAVTPSMIASIIVGRAPLTV